MRDEKVGGMGSWCRRRTAIVTAWASATENFAPIGMQVRHGVTNPEKFGKPSYCASVFGRPRNGISSTGAASRL